MGLSKPQLQAVAEILKLQIVQKNKKLKRSDFVINDVNIMPRKDPTSHKPILRYSFFVL